VDLIQLTPSAYHLHDGSNSGLILADGKAILVDTGLDKDSARKILQAVDSLGLALVAVVITHAHADHFGGAATVRGRAHVPVYAAPLEAAVVANPLLEPLYLFSGAAPVAELRHKFTLAEACPVDHFLMPGEATIEGIPLQIIPAPGHAPEQVIIAGGGVCFTGDACFAPPVLLKHGIPFYVDVDRTATSLRALARLDGSYLYFVPGHGEAVTTISPWVEQNLAHLAAIRAAVAGALAKSGEVSRIVELAAARMGVSIPNPVIYWLTQTTILACLSALQAAGQATVAVSANRLVWRPSGA
jgi:glyoxylase-like metal-dependent hydrolase (beta-lactamase superfamily II)